MKLNKFLVAAFAAATLLSCQKDDVNSETVNPDQTSEETITVNFQGTNVEVVKLENGFVRHGDLILAEENYSPADQPMPGVEEPPRVEVAGKLSIERVTKWPNNTVYYVIESDVNQRLRTVIQNSIDEWESKTNVRFVQRTNQTYYVTIRLSGQSCNCASASLGVQGANGRVNMGSGTTESVMIHEFGHTLGFPHEQNRSDRDNTITVLTENITQSGLSQYRKSNSITPLTSTVDVNSIMMYGSRTFGNGNGPTMIIKATGEPVPGFGRNLTALDIEGTNIAYPSDVTNPNPTPNPTDDICDGIAEWVRKAYAVGAKVTYRGFLFQRTQTGWNNLGECGTAPAPTDICDGVDAYNSNRQYSNGNKVTYQGSLYQAINNSWVLQGKCGA